MSLSKICKSCEITENDAKEIIIAHHNLEHFIPKKELKLVKGIEFSAESWHWIKKTAKALKVSTDAVVSGIIRIELDREKTKNKAK
jgi:hypothetical protein